MLNVSVLGFCVQENSPAKRRDSSIIFVFIVRLFFTMTGDYDYDHFYGVLGLMALLRAFCKH